jgi:hypothetical protein
MNLTAFNGIALRRFLPGGDRVVPEFYRATAAGLGTAPGAGAIFAQHTFIAGDGAVRGRLDRAEPGLLDNWLEDAVANLAVQYSAIVVRRAVYEQLGGFDASYDYYFDRDMWLRIAVEYPLWLEPQPLAECRVHEHGGSWAGGHRIASWLELRRSVDAAVERISPPAGRQVGRSARRHLVRLLIPELRRVVQKRDFRGCVVALAKLDDRFHESNHIRCHHKFLVSPCGAATSS